MKAKTIYEVLNFDRSQIDPLKKMGIGIGYKKWREDHDKKILFTYYCYLLDPMKNKETYWVHLYYSTKNESQTADSIYFSGERLIGGWEPRRGGIPFSLSNMQNKPDHMFNSAEASFWDNPEVFNKIIDQLSDPKKAEKWFKEMTEEWFEDPFDTMMRNWFNSGVTRVDHAELKFRG